MVWVGEIGGGRGKRIERHEGEMKETARGGNE
jgi:hypothetical protein